MNPKTELLWGLWVGMGGGLGFSSGVPRDSSWFEGFGIGVPKGPRYL